MLEGLTDIPDKPGVYIFRDENRTVLYVGKAKVLRSRIRSYFQKASALDDRKTAMVRLIRNFEYTVTGNELEAFVLEASLIKQYRPRFNILLRDDKGYPYLKLTTNETWPRLEVVRRIKKDGAKYYGPYVPSGDMWQLLAFIRTTFRIPTCAYSLEKRMRPCIQHQIKKCIAPCGGEVDHDKYLGMITQIRMLLEGRNKKLLELLEQRMQRLSEGLKFEEAAILRDRISSIRKVSETQKIVSPELGDIDVIGLSRTGARAAYKILFVRGGIMTGYRQFVVEDAYGESDHVLLKSFIEQFYSKELVLPSDVLCPVLPEDHGLIEDWLSGKKGGKVRISVPRRGVKRGLVDMAVENAAILLESSAGKSGQLLSGEIAALLGLSVTPVSIGAFDISNISGAEPVGGFVWWENGGFNKAYYRHIRMDAVKGPDDYAMMKEMVRRTFGKTEAPAEGEAQGESSLSLVNDCGKPVPDLVIIDGGPGQLEAALQAIKELGITAAVISIAKDPDRAFIPDRDAPVNLGSGERAALLLRRIRDEVHRFAVTYHKKLRGRRMLESPLEKIPGIGKKRRLELLRHFGSIGAIRSSSAEEIAALKGFNRPTAERLKESLNNDIKPAGK